MDGDPGPSCREGFWKQQLKWRPHIGSDESLALWEPGDLQEASGGIPSGALW